MKRAVAASAALAVLAAVLAAAAYTYTFNIVVGGTPMASGTLYIYDATGTLVDKAVVSNGAATATLDTGTYLLLAVGGNTAIAVVQQLSTTTTVSITTTGMYAITFNVTPSDMPVFDISITPLNAGVTATIAVPVNLTLYTPHTVNITVPREVRPSGFSFIKYVFTKAIVGGQEITSNSFTVASSAAVTLVYAKTYALPTLTQDQMIIVLVAAGVITLAIFLVALRGERTKAEIASAFEDEFVGAPERGEEGLRAIETRGEDEFVGSPE